MRNIPFVSNVARGVATITCVRLKNILLGQNDFEAE